MAVASSITAQGLAVGLEVGGEGIWQAGLSLCTLLALDMCGHGVD